jgi:hypothetical protein
MQRATDGRPANVLRRASAWQNWQPIPYDPAWIAWLNSMGWAGAGAIGGGAGLVGGR